MIILCEICAIEYFTIAGTSITSFTSTLKLLWQSPALNMLWGICRWVLYGLCDYVTQENTRYLFFFALWLRNASYLMYSCYCPPWGISSCLNFCPWPVSLFYFVSLSFLFARLSSVFDCLKCMYVTPCLRGNRHVKIYIHNIFLCVYVRI